MYSWVQIECTKVLKTQGTQCFHYPLTFAERLKPIFGTRIVIYHNVWRPKLFEKEKINNTLNLTAMKKMIFVLAFMMATTICVEGHNYYNKQVTISVQNFYDELLPFGDWINTPDYGYVWRPYLDNQEDFRPYSSRGNWVYTDLGWTWVSDYRWGWATFHYGRWYFDDYLGWMWIPGNEWAPAWVTWGSYNDFWAWAPMGPNIQVNFNLSWYTPQFWWTFVPRQHFCSNNWYLYIYNQPVQITNITYITNVYYENNYQHHNDNWFNGPRVRDVERHLNKRVQRMQLVDTDKPDNVIARNNRVQVYRPSVRSEREDVRPAKYRTVENGRTDTKNQRTDDLNTKRSSAIDNETRTSIQNGRNIVGSETRNQTVNRAVSNERTPRNNYENRSGSVNLNRSDPVKELAKQTVTRYSNVYQKANVDPQQTEKSNNRIYQRSSQTSTIDRNTGKNNDGNDRRRNTSEDKTKVKSTPTRSSSSSGTK